MLLNACKHHHSETLFIFDIFVSMTRLVVNLRLYLCDLFVSMTRLVVNLRLYLCELFVSMTRLVVNLMLYLCDLFFIFILIFIMINRKISWKQIYLFFCLFFRICLIIFRWRMWIYLEYQKFSLRMMLSICLFFTTFRLTLLIKVFLIKRVCDLLSFTDLYTTIN